MNKISLVIGGVGLTDVMECLASVYKNPLPDEIIYVIDEVGRECSPKIDYEIEDSVSANHPEVKILYNDNFSKWEMTNQTLNIGIKGSSCDYVMLTHEDVLFQDYDYFHPDWKLLEQKEKDLIGFSYPFKMLPPYIDKSPKRDIIKLGGGFTAISSIVRKNFFEEIGYLDEDLGIWYDSQVMAEIKIRGKWLIDLLGPPILHKVSKSMEANNYGAKWSKSPKWGLTPDNYKKRYGDLFDGRFITR